MHHRLMKQTQHKLQIVFNKQSLHMTSTGEADRHNLFDAEVLRAVAGHLGTAGSAGPQGFAVHVTLAQRECWLLFMHCHACRGDHN